ncbi:hypothetical protein [Bradyrhizobium sp.]|uniref:hypothetical protein n=1 Tax=Bradyrhizobium sp. TaxID=376 RepID=UPI0039E453C4
MANILILDDDPAVQIATRLTPESAGHATTAGRGAGRGRADRTFPDVVMPCMDVEAMRRIGRPDVSSGRG